MGVEASAGGQRLSLYRGTRVRRHLGEEERASLFRVLGRHDRDS